MEFGLPGPPGAPAANLVKVERNSRSGDVTKGHLMETSVRETARWSNTVAQTDALVLKLINK